MVRHAEAASPTALEAAYARCAAIARGHYENFTVASLFFPRHLLPFLFAIYAFCRHTDDLGDEASGDRLALLDAWEADLDRCLSGTPEHPVLLALGDTIRRFDMPDTPFRKLIEANRMDQRQARFATYADLLRYCDHSANPVGHMVLYVLGDRTAESQRLSDATCTALQLANFWQDVRRDYEKGRIYLPMEDMARFGCGEAEIRDGVASNAFRDLLRFEVERTRRLFEEGLPLISRLRGRARLDVALFSKGGLSVLDAIRRQRYDVLHRRPTVSRGRKAWLLASTAARLLALGRP
ncbi:MAG: squalene synthase HpnC [SAR202 cluster bacterium]|nr:squalene synthase HpnC [SAR202 cluster bacterium]